MSTFSENGKVLSGHPEPTGDGVIQTDSMASLEGAIAGNTRLVADEEATTQTSLKVTGNTDDQYILREDAGNAKPAGDPLTDRNESTETSIAEASDGAATSQLNLKISGAEISVERGSIPEIPNSEPFPTHDLVRENTGKRSIVVSVVEWDQSVPKLFCSQSIDFLGKRHSVPELPPALKESLLLPTGLADYGSTRDLFKNIRDLLKRYLTFFHNQDEIVAYWCIASWFPDVLDFIPRLTVTGPRFAADVLFRVLRCVSRRPVLLAGMNVAVLKTIPINKLMPTLLIRETGMSKRKAELLNALDQKDYLIASGTEIGQFYCAKCIYLGEEPSHQTVVADGIHVHVGNIRLPALLLPSDHEIESFQNKLFRYRSVHYDRIKSSRFTPEGLLPEVCAVAQQLGSAIVGDDDLEKRIVDVLKEKSEQGRVDRSSGRNAMVLRAVLFHCHQNDQQQVFAREIAATVNRIYSEEGESVRVSNETVGHLMKGLGFYSRRLGNGGRGLLLDRSTQSRAHELSCAYDVLPTEPACGYCHKFQIEQSEELV